VFVERGRSLCLEILGSRVTFTTNMYTPLNRGMVLLHLCRSQFSPNETFIAELIQFKVIFIHKNDIFTF